MKIFNSRTGKMHSTNVIHVTEEESRGVVNRIERAREEFADTPFRLAGLQGFPTSSFSAEAQEKLRRGESIPLEEFVPLPLITSENFTGYVYDAKTKQTLSMEISLKGTDVAGARLQFNEAVDALKARRAQEEKASQIDVIQGEFEAGIHQNIPAGKPLVLKPKR